MDSMGWLAPAESGSDSVSGYGGGAKKLERRRKRMVGRSHRSTWN